MDTSCNKVPETKSLTGPVQGLGFESTACKMCGSAILAPISLESQQLIGRFFLKYGLQFADTKLDDT